MKGWLLGVLQLSFTDLMHVSCCALSPKPFLCLVLLDALSGCCTTSQDNNKASEKVEFPFSLEWRSRGELCRYMQDNKQCKFTLCLYAVCGSWSLSVFSRGNEQFCEDRSVWGDASARAAGSGSQLLIWAPAENVPFGTIHETKFHCSKVIFFIFPI